MALVRPTLQQIIDRIAADFKTKITGATTLALRSVLMIMARVYGGVAHMLYGYIDNLSDQLFVASADSTYLELLGSEYGIIRNAAVNATGTITVTGSNGVDVPAGSELQNSAGYVYTTDELVTISGGTATVGITAQVAGEDSNDNPAVTLTFVSPIVGIDTTAVVDSDGISNGADEETDDDLRQRVLTRKQLPPHGGNENDYIVWAKEVAGVTRAWLYPGIHGPGTMALYFVRDDDSGSIFPSDAEIATVRSYLIQHVDKNGQTIGMPVTAEPGLFVEAPDPLTVNFTINIYENTAAVQAAVLAELEDLFYREGGPEQVIYLSRIVEAISRATGEVRNTLITPSTDVVAAFNELHQVGDVTFGDYV